jgi:hypothetical protein
MAKAKIHVVEVVLELSGEEAAVLAELVFKVGGPPAGPRGAIKSIEEALKGVGIKRSKDPSSGSIHFE